jgi:hypothetical protein
VAVAEPSGDAEDADTDEEAPATPEAESEAPAADED